MPVLRLAMLAALVAGCATRPTHVPDEERLVVVKSVRLPERDWLPWYTRFAEHAWVDVKDARGWHRVEWNSHLDAVQVDTLPAERATADERWERGVAVHGWLDGDEAQQVGANMLAVATGYPSARAYRAWPGPNSNSFVEWLARETGMPLQLPPNAVGKDYTPWLHAGLSSSRTGLELETLLLGAQVGLREGVELHLLGLTAGIGLWPPQLKLPFLLAIPGGWLAP